VLSSTEGEPPPAGGACASALAGTDTTNMMAAQRTVVDFT
jgi:hypothetical protein